MANHRDNSYPNSQRCSRLSTSGTFKCHLWAYLTSLPPPPPDRLFFPFLPASIFRLDTVVRGTPPVLLVDFQCLATTKHGLRRRGVVHQSMYTTACLPAARPFVFFFAPPKRASKADPEDH